MTGRRDKDFSGEIQRNQVANYIREQKYQEELDAWLRKIREEAFVDIMSASRSYPGSPSPQESLQASAPIFS